MYDTLPLMKIVLFILLSFSCLADDLNLIDYNYANIPLVLRNDNSLALEFDYTAYSDLSIQILGLVDFVKKRRLLPQTVSKSIKLSKENSPHTKIKKIKWDIGFGASLVKLLTDKLLKLGVTPFFGKEIYSKQQMKHKKQKLPTLKVPKSFEEFKKWQNGDEIEFTSRNGIYLNLNYQINFLTLFGPEAILQGIYKVKIKKEDNLLKLNVSTVKDREYLIRANFLLPFINVAKRKNISFSFNFEYDLSNAKELNDYLETLAGKLTINEENATSQKINKIKYFQYGARFPILFYAFKENKLHTQEYFEDDDKILEISYKYEEFKTKGILSLEKVQGLSYLNIINHQLKTFDSKILWTYKRNKTRGTIINNKIQKLSNELGLKSLRDIKFPNITYGFTKLIIEMSYQASQKILKSSKNTKELARGIYQKTNSKKLLKNLIKDGKLKVKLHVLSENLNKANIELN